MPVTVLRNKGTKAERLEVEYPESGGRRYQAIESYDPYTRRVLKKAVDEDTFESSKHLGETNARWADLNTSALIQAEESIKEEQAFRRRKRGGPSARVQAEALKK